MISIKKFFTEEELNIWYNNKLVNPKTKRRIKLYGPVYKKLKKSYDNYIIREKNIIINNDIVDKYSEFRNKLIDPLLIENLPLINIDNNDILFKFEYKWNPYTGERLEKDPNGSLFFDPDTLIHYFYINRLKKLWKEGYYQEEDYFQGHYDDAMGNGPDFYVNSRGKHPDWHLFRLPIPDCYLSKNHCYQSVTMGPILTDKEIRNIYNLAKKYKNNYKKRFNKKRPSLLRIKKLYYQAISKTPKLDINKNIIPHLDKVTLNELNYKANKKAIDLLIKL